ncbi:MAG TPA: RnfH family protein [Gammaproteobacteria bacterium]
MRVEVAYAAADDQLLLRLEMPAGTTVERAIRYSGVLDRFPEIDLTRNKVGVFGKVCRLDRELQDGERVEIYRELLADPKAARRRDRGAAADAD